jgi:uncharacterized DUF497 family protein
MDFDWSGFSSKDLSANEIAETFEDPFSLRLLPDANRFSRQARFFCIGKTLGGKGLFIVYTSTGKVIRVITARVMTEQETFFYERKIKENL